MGGPLTFSNLPAAPFVDAMIMGEAEDVLLPAFEAAVHRKVLHGWTRSRPSRAVRTGHPRRAAARRRQASDARLPAFAPIMAPDAELSDMFLIEEARMSSCARSV